VDLLETASSYNTRVVVPGNPTEEVDEVTNPFEGDAGDFDLLVQKIRDKHRVRVEVYGVAELSAASLIRAADKFVPIKDRLLL